VLLCIGEGSGAVLADFDFWKVLIVIPGLVTGTWDN